MFGYTKSTPLVAPPVVRGTSGVCDFVNEKLFIILGFREQRRNNIVRIFFCSLSSAAVSDPTRRRGSGASAVFALLCEHALR